MNKSIHHKEHEGKSIFLFLSFFVFFMFFVVKKF